MNDIIEAIGNLLAVIHRDGGHYAAERGILKACADAEQIVQRERLALQEITDERNALYSRISEQARSEEVKP